MSKLLVCNDSSSQAAKRLSFLESRFQLKQRGIQVLNLASHPLEEEIPQATHIVVLGASTEVPWSEEEITARLPSLDEAIADPTKRQILENALSPESKDGVFVERQEKPSHPEPIKLAPSKQPRGLIELNWHKSMDDCITGIDLLARRGLTIYLPRLGLFVGPTEWEDCLSYDEIKGIALVLKLISGQDIREIKWKDTILITGGGEK